MKGQRPMKSNIKNILRGVGVERASPEDPTAVKLTNFIEKELTNLNGVEKCEASLSTKTIILRIDDDIISKKDLLNV